MDAAWNEPFERFATLYAQARAADPDGYNAMTVATVDEQGHPQARVCLLKGVEERGFVFFTNRTSRKGRELERPGAWAALCFYWPKLQQQVRVEGAVAVTSAGEDDAYFATRPRESQLGAWASHQSEGLEQREDLEARLAEVSRQYEGNAVPRPPHWGGFRVAPERFEFWKAHAFRLHWRQEYLRQGEGWARRALNP